MRRPFFFFNGGRAGSWPLGNPALGSNATDFKDNGIPGIGTGVRRDVWIIQPGKIRSITHREDLGQEAVEGMDTHLSLNTQTIEEYLIAHRVAGRAMALLANHFGDNIEPLYPTLAVFGHVCLLSLSLSAAYSIIKKA
jgi:hypothetical protein